MTITTINGHDIVQVSRARAAWDQVMESHSRTPLQWGPTDSDRYLGDPKRIGFMMARYTFAAKMLKRCGSILDVGCGSGMGTLTFLQDTDATHVLGLDFEKEVIDFADQQMLPAAAMVRDVGALEFVDCDFMKSPFVNFEGLCCLDVIEHVEPSESGAFIDKIVGSLTDSGIAVVGTPSLASAPFASVHSKIGHINLYDPDRFRAELEAKFKHVFMFSMNDCHIGTHFDKLAHYLIVLCVK